MDERAGLTFMMRLLGASEVNQQARQTADSVSKLGSETKQAGDKADSAGRGWEHFKRRLGETDSKAKLAKFSVGGLVKKAAAFGVGYEALAGLHKAVDVTSELGEAAFKLHNIQGLTVRQGFELASVADVRGLAAGKLAQATGILARNVHQAVQQWDQHNTAVSHAADVEGKLSALRDRTNRQLVTLGASAQDQTRRQLLMDQYHASRQQIIATASKKAHDQQAKGAGTSADAFKTLGFTQDELAKSTGNMFPLLLKLEGAFNRLRGGRDKTQLALQIFGRGGIGGILPLFREGPLGLTKSLSLARQTVGQLADMGIKSTDQYLIAQQKSKFATLELQIAMGEFLLPAITKVNTVWAHLVSAIHRGSGPWGVIKTVVGGVASVVHTVTDWFGRSKVASEILGGALVALGAAWGVEKIIGFVGAIKKLWIIEKAIGLLSALRGALVGVAAAEAAAASGAGAAGFSGGLAGLLRFGGPIAAFAYGTGVFNPDTAGQTPGVERGQLRGIQAHEFAYYLAHPNRLADPGAITHLTPQLRKALRKALAGRHIPGLAAGGVVTGTGSWVTGESGPELNTMRGNQVRVQPLTGSGGRRQGLGDLTAKIREGVVEALQGLQSPVFLDGRELAESTVRWQLATVGRR